MKTSRKTGISLPFAATFVLSFAAAASLGEASNQPDEGIWQGIDERFLDPTAKRLNVPMAYRAVRLNKAALAQALAEAPMEFTREATENPAFIDLLMPDGTMARFRFMEAPVMAPELAAKFPEIKTYRGIGIDDPQATLRMDITPAGFHAQVLSPRGAVYIDPYWKNDSSLHISYYKRDLPKPVDDWRCLVPDDTETISLDTAARARPTGGLGIESSGATLRTYRLACAATGEYTMAHGGGTVADGMAAIVTAINRVTGVYEVELAIRLVLVANNDLIVYTNPSTDPYSPLSGAITLLNQNQSNLTNVIGSANYDIGHLFGTSGGGLAFPGAVCNTNNKARGTSGISPMYLDGDPFYIDLVAHEMGHQFGANHTFNGTTGSCAGNRNPSTAYEPDSGSTLMSFSGICLYQDLEPHPDPYFSFISYQEITSYVTTGLGSGCAVTSATGNNPPVVNAGPAFTIPARTPFTLTATGSDPDGDGLTFCWEEADLGPALSSTFDNGASPIFRSLNPTTSPSRTFPRLQNILSNTTTIGELLPTTTRTLNFKVTVRDNHLNGGGVSSASTIVSVISTAGPFVVTFPADPPFTFAGGSTQTVTWNVAGTTVAPINAANVNILLSTDGGLSFGTTLASNTPNDGTQSVLLPSMPTTTARIKIEAVGNIFFDISNAFSITGPSSTPTPTPAAINISGSISYCSNPVPGPVPNVTLNLTGSASGSTLSDGSGTYQFSSLASGGSYTVTPTKGTLAPGSTGITTVDVIAVQRHFLGLGSPLSGCRLTAADVNGSTVADTVDVIAVQRFFLGLSTGISNTGKYKFTPANRTYQGVVSNQTAQNYDTLIFGDVASPFAD